MEMEGDGTLAVVQYRYGGTEVRTATPVGSTEVPPGGQLG